jgi:DNA-binding response OmpR family regulator
MSRGKILVVDDDRLVLATLAHGLTQAGFEVTDVDNGDDAILQARQHRHDLALLDIRMEGKSGFDVAAYLRAYCNMPFMFLSAFADDDTIRQVKELGAVAYLVKPLDIGQIVPAVEAALAQSRSRARLEAGVAASGQSGSSLGGLATAEPQHLDQPAGARQVGEGELVAMAVGVLMHRYSLDRRGARQRLERMAQADSLALPAQAERLLQALELLCMTPQP